MYKGLVIRCYGRQENIPQFVNSDSFMADKNYVKWLSDLKKRFHIAQLKAAVKVNTEMLKFYHNLWKNLLPDWWIYLKRHRIWPKI